MRKKNWEMIDAKWAGGKLIFSHKLWKVKWKRRRGQYFAAIEANSSLSLCFSCCGFGISKIFQFPHRLRYQKSHTVCHYVYVCEKETVAGVIMWLSNLLTLFQVWFDRKIGENNKREGENEREFWLLQGKLIQVSSQSHCSTFRRD